MDRYHEWLRPTLLILAPYKLKFDDSEKNSEKNTKQKFRTKFVQMNWYLKR